MVKQRHSDNDRALFKGFEENSQKEYFISSKPFLSPYTFMVELCHEALLLERETIYAKDFFNEKKLSNKPNEIIYCVTDRAQDLYKYLMERKKKGMSKCSVIFGRSTIPVDKKFKCFTEDGLVNHVFTQNLHHKDENFTAIPLGLENRHWGEWNNPENNPNNILNWMSKSKNRNEREYLLYTSLTLQNNKKRTKRMYAEDYKY